MSKWGRRRWKFYVCMISMRDITRLSWKPRSWGRRKKLAMDEFGDYRSMGDIERNHSLLDRRVKDNLSRLSFM